MTDAYEAFHVHGGQLQSPIPSTATTEGQTQKQCTPHNHTPANTKKRGKTMAWGEMTLCRSHPKGEGRTDLQGFPATSGQGGPSHPHTKKVRGKGAP